MISIVIPNYNGLDHLEVCLNSLRNQIYKEFKIIIVDNNSTDNSIFYIQNSYPEVEILQNEENLGFSKAVNRGIKRALNINDSQYILLLNNDIECDKKFLSELINAFIDSRVGSVAPKMLNYYNRSIIDDTGNFIKLNGVPYQRGSGQIDIGQYNKPEFIFGACAGAVIYNKEVFERIGLFDEDFFAYYEDIDFSFRMQLYGYKCYFNPKAICYHKKSSTLKNQSELISYYCERNLVALRIKNYPTIIILKYFLVFFILRWIILLTYIRKNSIKSVLWSIKGHLKGLLEILKSIKKRRYIQKNKKVDDAYIMKLLSNKTPSRNFH